MVTQLIVRMTLASVTGIVTNYFFLNIFFKSQADQIQQEPCSSTGRSLSLSSPLASITRVPQLCHQLKASLFSQQQCTFSPKELTENTNQAVWKDFVLLVVFCFVSYKSKFADFILLAYSQWFFFRKHRHRNKLQSQPELPPKEIQEEGLKNTSIFPEKPIGT